MAFNFDENGKLIAPKHGQPEPLVVTDKSYDFSVYRQQGYSDNQIFNALIQKEPKLKTYTDQGYTPTQILGALEQKKKIFKDFNDPSTSPGFIDFNDLQKPIKPLEKTGTVGAIEQKAGADSTLQPDNSHTVAWGVGVAVFVAVALLAWFRFKKTEAVAGVVAAAQSPIHEQKNENPSYARPDPMLGTKLEKLQSAKKLFFILLSIDIAVTVIIFGSVIWAIGAMKDIELGVRTGDPSLASSIDFWGSFSKIVLLTTIGVGLGLVKWLKSCYQFAKESLHATGFKQEGWTVAGWIIPIIGIFKPYQVINEIYRAGSPTSSSGDDWKKESGSSLILTWWIFWVVTHLLMVTIGRETFKKASLNGEFSIPQIIDAYEVQAWVCVISIVIAGLWFVVANHLTQRLVDRSSRYAPKSSLSDSTKAAPISSDQRAVQNAPAVAKPTDTVRTPLTDTEPIMNNPPVNATPPIAMGSNQQSIPEIEDRLYEQIAQEIETNAVDKGIWTKAFAQSGGDDKQTRVAYIKARFAKLMVVENAKLEAMQKEWAEIARHEQEQYNREHVTAERRELLCKRIKVAESIGLDDVKELAASVEAADFLNWCCWNDINKVKESVDKNPLLLAITNSGGNTALHLAVIAKQLEVAKYLVGQGASVSERNNDGETPIDIAKKKDQLELVALLQ